MPDLSTLRADRRGAIGVVVGLLLPVLVLTVAFGIDVTGWHRDALHLQGLADRAATSAGPLWAAGNHDEAIAVAAALVRADEGNIRLDHAGAGKNTPPEAIEIIVSCNQRHLLGGLFPASRQSARAVAIKTRRIA